MKFYLTLTIERRGWRTHHMLVNCSRADLISAAITLASFASMGVMLAWRA